jgi:hypothetical protein
VKKNKTKLVIAVINLCFAFLLSCFFAPTTSSTTTGVSTGATSSGGGKKETKETIVYNNQQPQQQPVVIYQPAPASQQKAKTSNSSIRNFAVKSYDKIAKDSQKGSGEHLNSLILLMESEGVPKDESASLIKRALRKSNGNAEIFGDEIENSL